MKNRHKCLENNRDNLRESRTAFYPAPTGNTFRGTNRMGWHNSSPGSDPRYTVHLTSIRSDRKLHRAWVCWVPSWTWEVISPSETVTWYISSSSAPWWITRTPNWGPPPAPTSGCCRCYKPSVFALLRVHPGTLVAGIFTSLWVSNKGPGIAPPPPTLWRHSWVYRHMEDLPIYKQVEM